MARPLDGAAAAGDDFPRQIAKAKAKPDPDSEYKTFHIGPLRPNLCAAVVDRQVRKIPANTQKPPAWRGRGLSTFKAAGLGWGRQTFNVSALTGFQKRREFRLR